MIRSVPAYRWPASTLPAKPPAFPFIACSAPKCDWCPISWWGIDMSPQDYAAEAKAAVKQGYTSFKQKARPWFDVYEQAKLTCAAVPRNFKLDFDFNEHLVNAAHAITVLQELDAFSNIAIYEEPIPRGDLEGNKRIRAATRCAIALHYQPHMTVANLLNEMCDGYVVNGGASAILRANGLCSAANKLFWLQLVGTAWTTAMAMHLGSVCSHAQWPAVTCMNMYTHVLAKKPIEIKGGFARVPEGPGLGIEFDESALKKHRVDSPKRDNLKAIYAVVQQTRTKSGTPANTAPRATGPKTGPATSPATNTASNSKHGPTTAPKNGANYTTASKSPPCANKNFSATDGAPMNTDKKI